VSRECTGCGRPFAAADLCREECDGMEADRLAAGLDGVRFRYYRCPGCGRDDIVVDVLPLDDEFYEDFEARRDAMEAAVRQLRGEDARAGAVVVAVTS